MFGLGLPEILVILVIFLVLFGAKRLPQIGEGLGKTVKELRKMRGEKKTEKETEKEKEKGKEKKEKKVKKEERETPKEKKEKPKKTSSEKSK